MADLTENHGVSAFVSPQSWWFLKRYTGYRKWLLTRQAVKALYRLGEGAFESPQAGGELVGLSIIQNSEPERGAEMLLADASSGKEPSEKAAMLLGVDGLFVKYGDILKSGDLAYRAAVGGGGKIGDVASVLQGLVTGDSAQYFGKFWERPRNGHAWEFLQSTSSKTTYYGGLTDVILWEREQGRLAALAESVKGINHSAQNWRKGKPNWGKPGVVVSQMGNFPATLYLGDRYDHNCCAIVPSDDSEVVPLWLFCSSEVFANSVKALNQNRKIEVGTVLNTDYDRAHWHKAAAERYPHGLRKPSSSDPTQWLFDGQPGGSDRPLQVAVARLLGYQWPRQTGSRFPDCPVLGADSLEKIQDGDGVVCIPAVRGERPVHERLLKVLQTVWVDKWDDAILASLLSDGGSSNLDDWLRNGFFEQHCKLFHHRPFIWHIWDGRKRDGFHALVNSHKLAAGDGKGRRLLESLTYSYLGDWKTRQQDGVKRGEGGAEDRLAAALELQKQLVAILEGEPPFDLFVRWKPIEGQAIGWEPDINDGVRLNIRPFMARDLSGGKKDAGILRAKPNIHWKKDRGKELVRERVQYPWFWKNGKFTGERVNDAHFRLAEKRADREAARADGENSGSAK